MISGPNHATFDAYTRLLGDVDTLPWRGRLMEANGQWIESEGPGCQIGECCRIFSRGGPEFEGQVVGFRGNRTIIMTLESVAGLGFGDDVVATGEQPSVSAGETLLGRVVDPQGRPIDGKGPILERQRRPLRTIGRRPFDRMPITENYVTGIKAIDGLLTIGLGQRVAIFGGSGVGKSTLMSMLSRSAAGRITIIAMVGERGREVVEFVDKCNLEGAAGRTIFVVATSDQSPLLKMRAAEAATAMAEHFQEQGNDVLLIVDSITRYAMAAREIGLANGEPPTNKGYTPSVFSSLAKLVERAGRFKVGSVTAVYTVLMEGDDQQDPIVDAVRSFVDGHIVLSRDLAMEGWYPPIDILGSISRLMPAVVTKAHATNAQSVRHLLACYARSEDLIRIGAYTGGTDAELDRAIARRPAIREFLVQGAHASIGFAETGLQLQMLAG